MKRLINVLLILCLSWGTAAFAGRPCSDTQPTAQTVVKAMELAQKTKLSLDASGAEVALIARAGQDLSKYNLRYSHIAFAWRDHPEGRWTAVHELNQCGTAESALFNEGLGNFFLDDMFAYETQIIIPNPATQSRIAELLSTNVASKLHARRYSMLAYAFATTYQNSNQWVLEVLAAASSADATIRTREQAQSWLKLNGYQPITVNIPAMARLGGRMFRANVAFDDHPFDRRMAGLIDTVTVDSVARFVAARDPASKTFVVSLK